MVFTHWKAGIHAYRHGEKATGILWILPHSSLYQLPTEADISQIGSIRENFEIVNWTLWLGYNFCTLNSNKGTSPSRFSSRTFLLGHNDHTQAEYEALMNNVDSAINSKSRKLDIWSIKIDNAVNSKGVGARMIMTSFLGKYKGAWSIKLDSLLSNTQAEYEALIIWIMWTLPARIQALKAYSDSHIVVSQVTMSSQYTRRTWKPTLKELTT